MHKSRGRLNIRPDSSAADHPGVNSLAVHVKANRLPEKETSKSAASVGRNKHDSVWRRRERKRERKRHDGGDVSELAGRQG